MRRAIREGSDVARAADTAKTDIAEKLKLISQNNAIIDDAKMETDKLTAEIDELMRKHKLNGITDGKLVAELVEQFTRESRFIDPQRFHAACVREADFWACIEVMVTKAKEVMGTKELDKISKITPSKSQGVVLKIKEYKTEAKRKAK